MARIALSLFLIAIAAFGFIEGTVFLTEYMDEIDHNPILISIDTPLQYEKFLDGAYRHYFYGVVRVKAEAHDDVLGEAKRWAHSNVYEIHFTDEYSNVIVLSPRDQLVAAKFTRGDMFNKLPTNYNGYKIYVRDEKMITAADRSAVAQWPTSDVKFFDRFRAPISLA